MDLVRTPESRFDGLVGFPYAPRYADLRDGLRMHYVDEGPASAETVLLLHGQRRGRISTARWSSGWWRRACAS